MHFASDLIYENANDNFRTPGLKKSQYLQRDMRCFEILNFTEHFKDVKFRSSHEIGNSTQFLAMPTCLRIFLSHFAAVTHQVNDLDAGTVAVGVVFSTYEHSRIYSVNRSRSRSQSL